MVCLDRPPRLSELVVSIIFPRGGGRRGIIDRVSERGPGANDIGLSLHILETW